MQFVDRCSAAWQTHQSLLCVGLDPDLARLPKPLQHLPAEEAIEAFCRGVISATAQHAVAFKPQIAYFAAAGAERALERLSHWFKAQYPDHLWLLDAKRGDIGSTAERYAIEAYDRYLADAVTLNPYMGSDSLAPFLDRADRGVFLLCRTSNPGAEDLQNLALSDGSRLYERVAALAADTWNTAGQVGLVVGATAPQELARVREIAPMLPILVPGVGAQGGDPLAVIQAAGTADGGLFINASRSILYPISADDQGADWESARSDAAAELNQTLQSAWGKMIKTR